MPFTDLSIFNQTHFLCWKGTIASSFKIISINGYESLSSTYCYEVRSQTKLTKTQVSQWHGEPVSFSIGEGDYNLPVRYVHGIVTKIRYMQHTKELSECIFSIEPSISQLNIGRDLDIWQNISIPELVSTLLRKYKINNFEINIQSEYIPREYCMLYRESVLEFIQRVLEDEGLYYFFRHDESNHTLIITDNVSNHSLVHGDSFFWHHDSSIPSKGNVDYWDTSTSLLPKEVMIQGFNIEQASSIYSSLKTGPGIKYADTTTFIDITPQGKRKNIEHHARRLMSSNEANSVYYNAHVNAYWPSSGELFRLTSHPADDDTYIIHSLTLEATNNLDDNNSGYNCSIQAVTASKPWLPPVQHSPMTIPGVLTAIVVGPESEEIYTDEYGRIKIQFHWLKDKQSTCWVRVAQSWAGGKYGAQFIPRVGCEVLVSFIQGLPDFPVVIGTVYNGKNMPPFSLPVDKNESGFVTKSTTDGISGEGHRLSFNDKKGEERLTIISQKDFFLTVKNQISSTIGTNRSTQLTQGDDKLVLKRGNLSVTLENGSIQTNVTGNMTNELLNGKYSLKVNNGGINLNADRALVLESLQSIEFKVGNNKLSISPTGIVIKGTIVTIEGKGVTELKGAMTTISGSGMTRISGGIINIG